MLQYKFTNRVMYFEIILCISLLIFYRYPLSEIFSYSGFIVSGYQFNKLIISMILILLLIILGKYMKNNTYYFIYHIFFIMGVLPSYVMYIYSYNSIFTCLLITIPLLMLWFIDCLNVNIKINVKKLQLDNKTIYFFILIILITLLPFLKNINLIDINNLLFKDIYETRLAFRESENLLIGYLMSPLSRFLLPFIGIYALINKKKLVFTLTIIFITFIYLTSGSLKSLLFNYAIILFFYRKSSIEEKIYSFIKYLNIAIVFELMYFFLSNNIIFTTYFRRIFFVPVYLFDKYYSYFNDNFIYYKHTKIASIFGVDSELRDITLWFGEKVLGQDGLNANVGIFVEGYFSLGVIGVLIISFFFVLFCIFYRGLNIDIRYVGLLFGAITLFLSSTFETLLFTHGLLIYILILLFLIPKTKNSN